MDRCRMGDWECPYFEETHGGCCIPQKCPEYQFYKMNEEIDMTSEEKIEEILHNHKNDPMWFMTESGYSEREALKEICDWKEQEMINKALSNFCDAACGRGICKIKCDSVCDKRRYFESVITGKPMDTGIIAFDEIVGTIFDI